MKEIRYFYAPNAKDTNELPEAEAAHAFKVLRLKPGDKIFLVDGCGGLHEAELTIATNKRCLYKINHSENVSKTWNGHIHLAIAPTKMMDRMEWMAEKATEIGFDELTFLDCCFSERKTIKTERIERVVCSAIKQSHKTWMPKINGMTRLETFLNYTYDNPRFIAHCYEEIPSVDLFDEMNKEPASSKGATMLIGPEGDFSIDEVKLAISKGFKPVSLGKSRLRTETAGLYAVMMAQIVLRNK